MKLRIVFHVCSTGQKYIYTGSADDSVYVYDVVSIQIVLSSPSCMQVDMDTLGNTNVIELQSKNKQKKKKEKKNIWVASVIQFQMLMFYPWSLPKLWNKWVILIFLLQLTGAQIGIIRYHDGPVRDCSWHPFYPSLVTSSWDGVVATWGLPGGTTAVKPVPSRRSGRRRRITVYWTASCST